LVSILIIYIHQLRICHFFAGYLADWPWFVPLNTGMIPIENAYARVPKELNPYPSRAFGVAPVNVSECWVEITRPVVVFMVLKQL